jgi:hypothetical protein
VVYAHLQRLGLVCPARPSNDLCNQDRRMGEICISGPTRGEWVPFHRRPLQLYRLRLDCGCLQVVTAPSYSCRRARIGDAKRGGPERSGRPMGRWQSAEKSRRISEG